MTVPKPFMRVADMVRDLIPRMRVMLTPEESALAPHIRGNEPLLKALNALILARIEGRAHVPVPTDPVECKCLMAMDRELRWVLNRLDFVYRSPVNPEAHVNAERPE